MIIAIADLHLGSLIANKIGFQGFIHDFLKPNQSDISHLVMLGDILDLWRNTNSRVLAENADIITELGQLDMKKGFALTDEDIQAIEVDYYDGKIIRETYDEGYKKGSKAEFVAKQ